MDINELSAKEAHAFLNAHPEAKLIDVRTDQEYALSRIESAILINTQKQAEAILALPKETPLVFQCHHGVRSYQAAIWFQRRGFTHVFNLVGGIDAWSQDVDPKVPRY